MPARVDTGIGLYKRITTAATTVVKSGPGKLLRIIVGTTASGAITVYDSVGTSTAIVVALKASIPEGSYAIGAYCRNGITVVTGADSDITVVYE